MKQTANFGYTYPECDPPYVKDLADLPGQLKVLATEINDDVTALQASIVTAAAMPAAVMNRTVNQVLVPGDSFLFDNSLFNNNGMVDLGFDRFVIQTGGLYLITGSCTSGSVPTIFHNLTLSVSGSTVRTNSINPNLLGGDPLENNVTMVMMLSPGNTVTMSQNFTGAASITYSLVTLGITMLVRS
jgi:hypothetical protein